MPDLTLIPVHTPAAQLRPVFVHKLELWGVGGKIRLTPYGRLAPGTNSSRWIIGTIPIPRTAHDLLLAHPSQAEVFRDDKGRFLYLGLSLGGNGVLVLVPNTARHQIIRLPISQDELDSFKAFALDLVAKAGLLHVGALQGLPATGAEEDQAKAVIHDTRKIPCFPNTPEGKRASNRLARQRKDAALRLGLEERF